MSSKGHSSRTAGSDSGHRRRGTDSDEAHRHTAGSTASSTSTHKRSRGDDRRRREKSSRDDDTVTSTSHRRHSHKHNSSKKTHSSGRVRKQDEDSRIDESQDEGSGLEESPVATKSSRPKPAQSTFRGNEMTMRSPSTNYRDGAETQLARSARAEEGRWSSTATNDPAAYIGAAAEYYGSAGYKDSIVSQPGVRPHTPMIVGAQPHLMAASAEPAPPAESGSGGAAAEFYSSGNTGTGNSFGNAAFPRPPPSTSSHVNHTSSSHGGANGSNLPTYAAGAAAIGAATAAQSHYHKQQSSLHPRPPMPESSSTSLVHTHSHNSTTMPARVSSRGPVDTFVEWWNDYEDVRKMEEYTEYIGICRHCFDPRSSARDAPRPHRPRKVKSRESMKAGRVSKDRRYSAYDSDSRRKGNASWIGAGLAGLGLAKAFESSSSEDERLAHKTYTGKSVRRKSSGQVLAGQPECSPSRATPTRPQARVTVGGDGNVLTSERPTKAKMPLSNRPHDAIYFSEESSNSETGTSRPRISSTAGDGRKSSVMKAPSPLEKHASQSVRRRRASSSTSEDVGFFGSFFSTPKNQRKPKKGNRRRHQDSDASSISSTSNVSGRPAGAKLRKQQKRRRDSDKTARNAIMGLGAAAAALAASSEYQNRQSQKNQRLQRKNQEPKSSDDEWESATEDGFSDVSSGLAFGDNAIGNISSARSSSASISSQAPGIEKRSRRWGSPRQKRRRSDSRTLETTTPVVPSNLEPIHMAENGVYGPNDRQTSQLPLHQGPSRQSTANPSLPQITDSHSSQPTFQPPQAFSSPEAVTMQHPQPIAPKKADRNALEEHDTTPGVPVDHSYDDSHLQRVPISAPKHDLHDTPGASPPGLAGTRLDRESTMKERNHEYHDAIDHNADERKGRFDSKDIDVAGILAGATAAGVGASAFAKTRRESPVKKGRHDAERKSRDMDISNKKWRQPSPHPLKQARLPSDDDESEEVEESYSAQVIQAAFPSARQDVDPFSEPLQDHDDRKASNVSPKSPEPPYPPPSDEQPARSHEFMTETEGANGPRTYEVTRGRRPSEPIYDDELNDPDLFKRPKGDSQPGDSDAQVSGVMADLEHRYEHDDRSQAEVFALPEIHSNPNSSTRSFDASYGDKRLTGPNTAQGLTNFAHKRSIPRLNVIAPTPPRSTGGSMKGSRSPSPSSARSYGSKGSHEPVSPAAWSQEIDFPVEREHDDFDVNVGGQGSSQHPDEFSVGRNTANHISDVLSRESTRFEIDEAIEDIPIENRDSGDQEKRDAFTLESLQDALDPSPSAGGFVEGEVSDQQEARIADHASQSEERVTDSQDEDFQPHGSDESGRKRPFAHEITSGSEEPTQNETAGRGRDDNSRSKQAARQREDLGYRDIMQSSEGIKMSSGGVLASATAAAGAFSMAGKQRSRKQRDLHSPDRRHSSVSPPARSRKYMPGNFSSDDEREISMDRDHERQRFAFGNHDSRYDENVTRTADDARRPNESYPAEDYTEKNTATPSRQYEPLNPDDPASHQQSTLEHSPSLLGTTYGEEPSHTDRRDVEEIAPSSLQETFSGIKSKKDKKKNSRYSQFEENEPSFETEKGTADVETRVQEEEGVAPLEENVAFDESNLSAKQRKKLAKKRGKQLPLDIDAQTVDIPTRQIAEEGHLQHQQTPAQEHVLDESNLSSKQRKTLAKKRDQEEPLDVEARSQDVGEPHIREGRDPESEHVSAQDPAFDHSNLSSKQRKKLAKKRSSQAPLDSEARNRDVGDAQFQEEIPRQSEHFPAHDTAPAPESLSGLSSKQRKKLAKRQDKESNQEFFNAPESSTTADYGGDFSHDTPVVENAGAEFAVSSKQRKKLAKRRKSEQSEPLEDRSGGFSESTGRTVSWDQIADDDSGMSSRLPASKAHDTMEDPSTHDSKKDGFEARQSRPSSVVEPLYYEALFQAASIPLPDSRPGSPSSSDIDHPDPMTVQVEHRDEGEATSTSSPVRTPSTTAIPLRFRRPPHSPSTSKDFSHPSPTAADFSLPATPRAAKARPASTEFKASHDIRPLYLVERNIKVPEPDASLPSLPSSHTTSRAPSVQDSSEEAYASAPESPNASVAGNEHELFADFDNSREQDRGENYLDSGQTTPRAGTVSPKVTSPETTQYDQARHDQQAESQIEPAKVIQANLGPISSTPNKPSSSLASMSGGATLGTAFGAGAVADSLFSAPGARSSSFADPKTGDTSRDTSFEQHLENSPRSHDFSKDTEAADVQQDNGAADSTEASRAQSQLDEGASFASRLKSQKKKDKKNKKRNRTVLEPANDIERISTPSDIVVQNLDVSAEIDEPPRTAVKFNHRSIPRQTDPETPDESNELESQDMAIPNQSFPNEETESASMPINETFDRDAQILDKPMHESSIAFQPDDLPQDTYTQDEDRSQSALDDPLEHEQPHSLDPEVSEIEKLEEGILPASIALPEDNEDDLDPELSEIEKLEEGILPASIALPEESEDDLFGDGAEMRDQTRDIEDTSNPRRRSEGASERTFLPSDGRNHSTQVIMDDTSLTSARFDADHGPGVDSLEHDRYQDTPEILDVEAQMQAVITSTPKEIGEHDSSESLAQASVEKQQPAQEPQPAEETTAKGKRPVEHMEEEPEAESSWFSSWLPGKKNKKGKHVKGKKQVQPPEKPTTSLQGQSDQLTDILSGDVDPSADVSTSAGAQTEPTIKVTTNDPESKDVRYITESQDRLLERPSVVDVWAVPTKRSKAKKGKKKMSDRADTPTTGQATDGFELGRSATDVPGVAEISGLPNTFIMANSQESAQRISPGAVEAEFDPDIERSTPSLEFGVKHSPGNEKALHSSPQQVATEEHQLSEAERSVEEPTDLRENLENASPPGTFEEVAYAEEETQSREFTENVGDLESGYTEVQQLSTLESQSQPDEDAKPEAEDFKKLAYQEDVGTVHENGKGKYDTVSEAPWPEEFPSAHLVEVSGEPATETVADDARDFASGSKKKKGKNGKQHQASGVLAQPEAMRQTQDRNARSEPQQPEGHPTLSVETPPEPVEETNADDEWNITSSSKKKKGKKTKKQQASDTLVQSEDMPQDRDHPMPSETPQPEVAPFDPVDRSTELTNETQPDDEWNITGSSKKKKGKKSQQNQPISISSEPEIIPATSAEPSTEPTNESQPDDEWSTTGSSKKKKGNKGKQHQPTGISYQLEEPSPITFGTSQEPSKEIELDNEWNTTGSSAKKKGKKNKQPLPADIPSQSEEASPRIIEASQEVPNETYADDEWNNASGLPKRKGKKGKKQASAVSPQREKVPQDQEQSAETSSVTEQGLETTGSFPIVPTSSLKQKKDKKKNKVDWSHFVEDPPAEQPLLTTDANDFNANPETEYQDEPGDTHNHDVKQFKEDQDPVEHLAEPADQQESVELRNYIPAAEHVDTGTTEIGVKEDEIINDPEAVESTNSVGQETPVPSFEDKAPADGLDPSGTSIAIDKEEHPSENHTLEVSKENQPEAGELYEPAAQDESIEPPFTISSKQAKKKAKKNKKLKWEPLSDTQEEQSSEQNLKPAISSHSHKHRESKTEGKVDKTNRSDSDGDSKIDAKHSDFRKPNDNATDPNEPQTIPETISTAKVEERGNDVEGMEPSSQPSQLGDEAATGQVAEGQTADAGPYAAANQTEKGEVAASPTPEADSHAQMEVTGITGPKKSSKISKKEKRRAKKTQHLGVNEDEGELQPQQNQNEEIKAMDEAMSSSKSVEPGFSARDDHSKTDGDQVKAFGYADRGVTRDEDAQALDQNPQLFHDQGNVQVPRAFIDTGDAQPWDTGDLEAAKHLEGRDEGSTEDNVKEISKDDDFETSVLAGLQNAGFNPNIVTETSEFPPAVDKFTDEPGPESFTFTSKKSKKKAKKREQSALASQARPIRETEPTPERAEPEPVMDQESTELQADQKSSIDHPTKDSPEAAPSVSEKDSAFDDIVAAGLEEAGFAAALGQGANPYAVDNSSRDLDSEKTEVGVQHQQQGTNSELGSRRTPSPSQLWQSGGSPIQDEFKYPKPQTTTQGEEGVNPKFHDEAPAPAEATEDWPMFSFKREKKKAKKAHASEMDDELSLQESPNEKTYGDALPAGNSNQSDQSNAFEPSSKKKKKGKKARAIEMDQEPNLQDTSNAKTKELVPPAAVFTQPDEFEPFKPSSKKKREKKGRASEMDDETSLQETSTEKITADLLPAEVSLQPTEFDAVEPSSKKKGKRTRHSEADQEPSLQDASLKKITTDPLSAEVSTQANEFASFEPSSKKKKKKNRKMQLEDDNADSLTQQGPGFGSLEQTTNQTIDGFEPPSYDEQTRARGKNNAEPLTSSEFQDSPSKDMLDERQQAPAHSIPMPQREDDRFNEEAPREDPVFESAQYLDRDSYTDADKDDYSERQDFHMQDAPRDDDTERQYAGAQQSDMAKKSIGDIYPPSPVESTSRNRASYLFSSPPAEFESTERDSAESRDLILPVTFQAEQIPEGTSESPATDTFPDDRRYRERNPTPLYHELGAIPETSREQSPSGKPYPTPAPSEWDFEKGAPVEKDARGGKSPSRAVDTTQDVHEDHDAFAARNLRHRQSLSPNPNGHAESILQPKRRKGSGISSGTESEVPNTKKAYSRQGIKDENEPMRSFSALSDRSGSAVSQRSGTPTLRRVDSVPSERSASSDLRAANKRDADLTLHAKAEEGKSTISTTSSLDRPHNYQPLRGLGEVRRSDMAEAGVLEAVGSMRGSPRSPHRPPSIRKRQSSQILDLENRLDQVIAENRSLQEARDRAVSGTDPGTAKNLQNTIQSRDIQLREKDVEINSLRASLETLQNEAARLSDHSQQLQEANEGLASDADSRYRSLQDEHQETQRQWQESLRQLDSLRQTHASMSERMSDAEPEELSRRLQEKDDEINYLRAQLDDASQKIGGLQRQLMATNTSEDFLNVRDEDYFDSACQQLCQHVQQWVLRFSKYSDNRACRVSAQIHDEKIETRLDNAILDGTDVDMYLSDRIKRRDVFMAVAMTMIWEFVFTRYLFGMDREQRQKLKSLEKTLSDVGPPRAVAQWRATTLSLLSRREAFFDLRSQDTDAVVDEIYRTLERLLPPPNHLVKQVKDSLRNVMSLAVDLSVEMRTQRAEYVMLPPLQPEYDIHGDLARNVYFNATLMNERSGEFTSNEELEENQSVVRMVLFPLVVKKGNDLGETEEEVVVCPAQVLVARPGKGKKVRIMSEMPADSNHSMHSVAPSTVPDA
ncbi:MAG: hypothetical protein M1831_005681 [Alyxoria varia]|nr:MAG: hypothetical protein M1831_005681 [Alyxoria varia]